MAARMPATATTMVSSMRVKPLLGDTVISLEDRLSRIRAFTPKFDPASPPLEVLTFASLTKPPASTRVRVQSHPARLPPGAVQVAIRNTRHRARCGTFWPVRALRSPPCKGRCYSLCARQNRPLSSTEQACGHTYLRHARSQEAAVQSGRARQGEDVRLRHDGAGRAARGTPALLDRGGRDPALPGASRV